MREQIELLTSLDRRVKALEQLETMSRRESIIASSLLRSEILGLLGLRGYWPGNAYIYDGTEYELSDQSGNKITFDVGGGQPETNLAATIDYPEVVYDGSNDFNMMVSDYNNYKITGTETGVASAYRGLTLGAWCYFDTTASGVEYIMAKRQAAVVSYYLYRSSGGYPLFGVTDDASDTRDATGSVAIGSGSWHFIVGKFDPSTDVQVFHNGTWYTNTTTPHASIYDGTAKLTLSARDDAATPGQFKLDGRLAHIWLCAANISDDTIERLWQISRVVFGV